MTTALFAAIDRLGNHLLNQDFDWVLDNLRDLDFNLASLFDGLELVGYFFANQFPLFLGCLNAIEHIALRQLEHDLRFFVAIRFVSIQLAHDFTSVRFSDAHFPAQSADFVAMDTFTNLGYRKLALACLRNRYVDSLALFFRDLLGLDFVFEVAAFLEDLALFRDSPKDRIRLVALFANVLDACFHASFHDGGRHHHGAFDQARLFARCTAFLAMSAAEHGSSRAHNQQHAEPVESESCHLRCFRR
jgi:hypothetical protein